MHLVLFLNYGRLCTRDSFSVQYSSEEASVVSLARITRERAHDEYGGQQTSNNTSLLELGEE